MTGMGEKHESSARPRAARAAGAARSPRRGGNPQVSRMYPWSALHDPTATAGWEMMEHTDPAPRLEAIGEALGRAASIVLGQAVTASYAVNWPSCSQHSAGS